MAQPPKASREERPVTSTVPLPHRSRPERGKELQDRATRVAELRRAWLEGRLDLSVPEEAPGLGRLLDDILER
jgi:hypothetical protein